MSDRLVWLFIVPSVLCAPGFAQSNVRPLPQVAMSGRAMALAGTRSVAVDRYATPGPAVSTYEDLAAVPEQPEAVPTAEMQLAASFLPAADLDAAPGTIAIQRGGWDAQIGYTADEDRSLLINLHTEATFYEFDGADTIVPGSPQPFNDVYDTSLGTSLWVANTSRTSWFTGVQLGLSGEDDASIGDALSLGGVAGIRYQPRDNIAFKLGLAAQTRLEDQPWIIPFLGFEWHIDERWMLEAEGSRARLEGELGEHWSIFGEAAFQARQYRLNEDGPLPSGVAQDEQITIGTGIVWRPAKGINLSLQGGLVAWQELTMLDSNGDKVSENESMPGPYAGFGVQISF